MVRSGTQENHISHGDKGHSIHANTKLGQHACLIFVLEVQNRKSKGEPAGAAHQALPLRARSRLEIRVCVFSSSFPRNMQPTHFTGKREKARKHFKFSV